MKRLRTFEKKSTEETDAMKNCALTKTIAFAEKSVVDLEELMSYCLIEMCLSIFNIYGQMRKGLTPFRTVPYILKQYNKDTALRQNS